MTMHDSDPAERHENHVRKRRDGKGDAWSNAHRINLGNHFLMHDQDASFGCLVFGSNTGDKLFLEYEPDNYKNRQSDIRQFAMVALFDRKATERAAFCQNNALSRAFYLWQCRAFAQGQPKPPRFFIVVGRQTPPWTMIELDIGTGARVGEPVEVDASRFKDVWESLGLTALRRELRAYVNPRMKDESAA